MDAPRVVHPPGMKGMAPHDPPHPAQKAHQDGATTKSAALHQESAAKAKAAKLLADSVAK